MEKSRSMIKSHLVCVYEYRTSLDPHLGQRTGSLGFMFIRAFPVYTFTVKFVTGRMAEIGYGISGATFGGPGNLEPEGGCGNEQDREDRRRLAKRALAGRIRGDAPEGHGAGVHRPL